MKVSQGPGGEGLMVFVQRDWMTLPKLPLDLCISVTFAFISHHGKAWDEGARCSTSTTLLENNQNISELLALHITQGPGPHTTYP